MPIFARRRLRSMLDDLSAHLNAEQEKHLLQRLENRNTDAALGAEAELSLLWAISRVAHLEVEPMLSGSNKRPDGFSKNLFSSTGAYIEIRAISDDSFSGQEAMGRTSNIIIGFADRLRKNAGNHIFFEFLERSYHRNGRYHRERCVDPEFGLTESVEQLLRWWICENNYQTHPQIRIPEGKTDVVLQWKKQELRANRFHCSMPAIAYDYEDNPIYKALKQKRRQVQSGEPGHLRCVFLVDAGCSLLNRLAPDSPGTMQIGAQGIIWYALRKFTSIDFVCVFTPYRQPPMLFGAGRQMFWKVMFFDKRQGVLKSEYDHLVTMARQLPAPALEGYQARDRHKLGHFKPQSRTKYVTSTITWGNGKMTIKISSRLVHEYLAGRINAEEFRRQAFHDEKNFFEGELARGSTINNVRYEGGGIDQDDDYLVFDLGFDWGAHPLVSKGKPVN